MANDRNEPRIIDSTARVVKTVPLNRWENLLYEASHKKFNTKKVKESLVIAALSGTAILTANLAIDVVNNLASKVHDVEEALYNAPLGWANHLGGQTLFMETPNFWTTTSEQRAENVKTIVMIDGIAASGLMGYFLLRKGLGQLKSKRKQKF